MHRGRTVVLSGPSGSGKSAQVDALLGLCGRDTSRSAEFTERRLLAGARIGVVFQEPALFDDRTVLENLELALALGEGDAAAEISEILAQAQLVGRERALVAQLSGREKRRLAVARALLDRFDLLVLDSHAATTASGI